MVKRTSISINETVLADIDRKVKEGIFRNRSHAIEEGCKKLLSEQNA